jgi:hypothetical protein
VPFRMATAGAVSGWSVRAVVCTLYTR